MNVKPGNLRDVRSEGLVLCASNADHTGACIGDAGKRSIAARLRLVLLAVRVRARLRLPACSAAAARRLNPQRWIS